MLRLGDRNGRKLNLARGPLILLCEEHMQIIYAAFVGSLITAETGK
jgi:hypothetical protein